MTIAVIDFGTSNTLAGYVNNEGVQMVELEKGSLSMPTMLYVDKVPVAPAPVNEVFFKDRLQKEKVSYIKEQEKEILASISEMEFESEEEKFDYVHAKALQGWEREKGAMAKLVRQALERENKKIAEERTHAQSVKDALAHGASVYFGSEAYTHYLEDPDGGIFVDSPKSFLGSPLKAYHKAHFTLVIKLILSHIKVKIEASANETITHVVLGHPVQFHGLQGESGNQQALSILEEAAKQAGFDSVTFIEEPKAAMYYYEQDLQENKQVLIVDIGGGTTDCVFAKVGPTFRDATGAHPEVLAAYGQRIGGKNIDITLAYKLVMILFGKDMQWRDGYIPSSLFLNAVTVTDIPSLQKFKHHSTRDDIMTYMRLSDENTRKQLARLLEYQRIGYHSQLIHDVEDTKIALSKEDLVELDLSEIENDLTLTIDRASADAAMEPEVDTMMDVMLTCKEDAQLEPDVIFITGGTAQLSLVKEKIGMHFPSTEIVSGDFFGGVAKGICAYASQKLVSDSLCR